MTIYETIRAQMADAVPFAKHIGVELIEIAPGRGVARLEQSGQVSNHIGTMHAGALFTLAETASGAAMTGTFADIIMAVRPVAAEARVRYLKLARGPLTATATTVEPPEALRAKLDADKKVAFDVAVDVTDEKGQSVAALTVAWNVRRG